MVQPVRRRPGCAEDGLAEARGVALWKAQQEQAPRRCDFVAVLKRWSFRWQIDVHS